MKNILIKSISVATLLLGLALTSQSAFADTMQTTSVMPTGNNVAVQVMTHLCNSNIKNMDDFRALETGRDPVAALANTVLNCPTTGLPGNEAVTGTVASPRIMYNFSVMGEHNQSQMLANSTFMQHKLSEADINKDVDGNGTISSSTALDISHYEFATMADNGRVTVTETMPPAGFHFGALRFTPSSLISNNDAESLLSIDPVQGRIQLDMSHDSDKTVMLHVYQFVNNGSTGTTTPGTTDNSSIISQIHSLQSQIQNLFAQIQNLLGQLK